MRSDKKIYFQHLDALRFWAFIALFSFHKFYNEFDYNTDSKLSEVLSFIFSKGNASVNFFFILSSFLITYFLLQEKKKTDTISLRIFYTKRMLRTWPLYFITLLSGFYFLPYMLGDLSMFQREENANQLYYFTFLSNLDIIKNGIPRFGGLGVFWTLSMEEQYYLVWPLLLLLFHRRLIWLFGIIIMCAFIFRSFHYQDSDILYFHPFSVMSDFAIGALLAWLCLHSSTFTDKISNMAKSSILVVYLLGLAITLVWYTVFKTTYFVVFERLIAGLFFAFIIAEQVFARNSFYKVGTWTFANYWGKKSYALYCFHCFGILFSHLIIKKMGVPQNDFTILLIETLLALAISFFFGWLSEVLIESPLRKVKDKFVSNMRV